MLFRSVHLSVRIPYPNLVAGQSVAVTVFVMNDDLVRYDPALPASTLAMELLSPSGEVVWTQQYAVPEISYYNSWNRSVTIDVPSAAAQGLYRITSRLLLDAQPIAHSDDDLFVARPDWPQFQNAAQHAIALYDTSGATDTELAALGLAPVRVTQLQLAVLQPYDLLIIGKNSFDTAVKNAQIGRAHV